MEAKKWYCSKDDLVTQSVDLLEHGAYTRESGVLQSVEKALYKLTKNELGQFYAVLLTCVKVKPTNSGPKIVYHRLGREYRKLERHEVIKEGAMHSWCLGELILLADPDNSIGKKPSDFSSERDFYNPIK